MNPDHITEWLLAFAVAMVAVAVIFAIASHIAVSRGSADSGQWTGDDRSDVGDDTLAMLSGGPLPGPRDVQAARWPDEDTGISDEQFSRELRALLGKERDQ